MMFDFQRRSSGFRAPRGSRPEAVVPNHFRAPRSNVALDRGHLRSKGLDDCYSPDSFVSSRLSAERSLCCKSGGPVHSESSNPIVYCESRYLRVGRVSKRGDVQQHSSWKQQLTSSAAAGYAAKLSCTAPVHTAHARGGSLRNMAQDMSRPVQKQQVYANPDTRCHLCPARLISKEGLFLETAKALNHICER